MSRSRIEVTVTLELGATYYGERATAACLRLISASKPNNTHRNNIP